VVLFEDTWLRHVLDPHSGHVELEPHLGRCSKQSPRQIIEKQTPGRTESGSSRGT
jgi:hypothetical protein